MTKELKVSAIKEGTVIDHLPPESTFKVIGILDLDEVDEIVTVANNLTSKNMRKKGIVKVGGRTLTPQEVNKIALIAPNATVNIIKDYSVTKKIQVDIPENIENTVKCSNPKCITNHEGTSTKFRVLRKEPLKIRCHYCERDMGRDDIVLM